MNLVVYQGSSFDHDFIADFDLTGYTINTAVYHWRGSTESVVSTSTTLNNTITLSIAPSETLKMIDNYYFKVTATKDGVTKIVSYGTILLKRQL